MKSDVPASDFEFLICPHPVIPVIRLGDLPEDRDRQVARHLSSLQYDVRKIMPEA